MPQSNAHRQKQYRQRASLERIRNAYTVTLMLRECEKANIDIWPTITEIADEIFSHNGDGLEFVRRIAPLVFAFILTRNLVEG